MFLSNFGNFNKYKLYRCDWIWIFFPTKFIRSDFCYGCFCIYSFALFHSNLCIRISNQQRCSNYRFHCFNCCDARLRCSRSSFFRCPCSLSLVQLIKFVLFVLTPINELTSVHLIFVCFISFSFFLTRSGHCFVILRNKINCFPRSDQHLHVFHSNVATKNKLSKVNTIFGEEIDEILV